jgi:hypothetical protein
MDAVRGYKAPRLGGSVGWWEHDEPTYYQTALDAIWERMIAGDTKDHDNCE